jgi:hypothetical protein
MNYKHVQEYGRIAVGQLVRSPSAHNPFPVSVRHVLGDD